MFYCFSPSVALSPQDPKLIILTTGKAPPKQHCVQNVWSEMCCRFEWLRAKSAKDVTLLFPLQTFLLSCLLVCAAVPVGTSCFVSRSVRCKMWLPSSDWLILSSPRSHGRPAGSHPVPDVHVLLLLRSVGSR